MFFLCLNIILTFTKFLLFSLLFVHFILNQHFLQVIALLITLFSLQLSLCLHFCFKSFNKLDFLFKIVLFIKSFFSFFFQQLSITTLFLLLGFYSLKIPSFLFTHSEKFNVLLLQFIVKTFFFLICTVTIRFLLHLPVQFLAHQTTTLLLTE